MKIAIIGSGFVGLVAGACLADFGMLVTCVDADRAKLRQLARGRIPIYEPQLQELARRNLRSRRLRFSADLPRAVDECAVLFICVGTESKRDGAANLAHVRSAAQTIGRHMRDYKVVVIKSTVPVGTADEVVGWIRGAQQTSADFDVVSNPEFLREGSAVEDFMRPDRVILGCTSPRALAILKEIYHPLYLIERPFVVADHRTAELIKYATNCFLAVKISYINEIARLCDCLGADVHVVAKAMGLDGRIGPKFLHPGLGFGGSCLPKDTRAFLKICERRGLQAKLVRAAIEANREQHREIARKLERALGGLRGRQLGLLGLSYKPNTNDVRESPALDLARLLLRLGARLSAFDPIATETARAVLQSRRLRYVRNSYQVARRADAVIVATEWNEFRNLDLARLKSLMAGDVLLDARNVYEPEVAARLGFRYLGVGRGSSGPC